MTAIAEYLIKANLCLAGFYGLYYLLLRRHTFFTLNRVYLLVALVASFLLPLISLPEPVVETVALPVISLPVTVVAEQPTGPTLDEVLLTVYGAVSLLFFSLLTISLWRLMQLIRSGEATRQSDHTLVLLADDRVAPFSFFRYLVLNTTDFGQHADPIIRHELAHIRQWHSIDVLLAELVKIVCWPNPVAWLYKRSLQQVHEYLADQQAADKVAYARFLFDYAFEGTPSPVTNSFFTPALLTQRIRMLYQSRNTSRALWKYALVLPLLAVLVGLTAARERIVEEIQGNGPSIVLDVTMAGHVFSRDGHPLVGAHIIVRNTNRGVETTGPNGYFKLANIPSTAILIISHVGYQSTELPASDNQHIVANMQPMTIPLSEVVVKAQAESKDTIPVPNTTAGQTEVFTVVEQNPEFPGGMVALGQYVSQNLRYPAEARQQRASGVVFVQFVVGIDGAIQSPRVLKGIGNGCDEEAVRLVSQMPRWKPGIQNGTPVNVQFNLPIRFMLESSQAAPLPGVSTPQSETTVTVRSQTLSGEKPLVIIDGIKQSRDYDLNAIKADDIESINVLKGESAQATYGEKGKAGVILIKTKAKKP